MAEPMVKTLADFLEITREALGVAAAALALARTEAHDPAATPNQVRLLEELEAAQESVAMAWQAASLAQWLETAEEEAAQKAGPS